MPNAGTAVIIIFVLIIGFSFIVLLSCAFINNCCVNDSIRDEFDISSDTINGIFTRNEPKKNKEQSSTGIIEI